MKKMFKRISVFMMACMLLASMALSASAGNTADADIGTEESPFVLYTFNKYTACRKKTDSTPIYMYYTRGTQDSTRVSVYGSNVNSNASANYHNQTLSNGYLNNYVYVKLNVKSSIRSLVYENNYTYAVLGIRSLTDAGDQIIGKWSPDSTRVYTVATR